MPQEPLELTVEELDLLVTIQQDLSPSVGSIRKLLRALPRNSAEAAQANGWLDRLIAIDSQIADLLTRELGPEEW